MGIKSPNHPACPHCGSGDTRCQQTFLKRGFRMRRRKCFSCGQIFYTGQPLEQVTPCLDPRILPLYPYVKAAG
jgi:hypothetical protein